MKVRKSFVMLLIVALTSFAMLAFRPMLQVEPPVTVTILDIILKIVAGFATLAGVSALVAVLVQIMKLMGIAKDDTAAKWAAGFNLFAFIVLVAFGVFQPQIALEVLDGYAAQIAVIALFVLGFVTQMTVSKPTYNAFRAASVPLLGKSNSG